MEPKEDEEKEAETIAAPGPVANIDLEGEFATLVGGMERRLAAAARLNEAEELGHSGRNDGPKVAVKHVLADVASDLGRPNLVAKAWRKVAGWL